MSLLGDHKMEVVKVAKACQYVSHELASYGPPSRMGEQAHAVVPQAVRKSRPKPKSTCSANGQGWSRFGYELWKFLLDPRKFFLDPSCAHGVSPKFHERLLANHPGKAKYSTAAGPVVGGQFLQAFHVQMLIYALRDEMLACLGEYKHRIGSGGETEINKLAQQCKVFLAQKWRRPMCRAADIAYGQALGAHLF
jgi:hypothetical protein